MSDGDGTAALAALDTVLAAKPVHDGQAFVDATEHLCSLRTRLIVQCRAGSDRRAALRSLNGIISSTLSGHFPLGAAPWALIEDARTSLRELVNRETDLL